jgi:hypothetical protein
VTPPSAQYQWQKAAARSLAAAHVRRQGRAGRVIASLLGAAFVLVAACTLTNDDYVPPLVTSEPLEPGGGDAGVGDANVNDAGVCAAGLECCDDAACPVGQVCRDGACLALAGSDAGCVGADCPGAAPVPLGPSCDDGEQNGDETGSDCGGSCPSRCTVGGTCELDSDCAEGLFCGGESSRCVAPACDDNVLNGAETALDCGGGTCTACPDDAACLEGRDCQSRVCGDDGTCAAPACGDGQQNGDETAVDCGGSCPQNCGTGAGCAGGRDCQSGVCGTQGCGAGAGNCCQAPSCTDNVQNGGESDTDCGAQGCPDCGLGESCQFNGQCQSNQCLNGVCNNVPTCTDDQQNGTETGVDCGGGCPLCPDLSGCNLATDCLSNNCDARGICISCGDNVQDGTETGTDCGGADPACRRCNTGETCQSNTDCVSQFCFGGVC